MLLSENADFTSLKGEWISQMWDQKEIDPLCRIIIIQWGLLDKRRGEIRAANNGVPLDKIVSTRPIVHQQNALMLLLVQMKAPAKTELPVIYHTTLNK